MYRNKEEWKGIIPALLTPLNEDGSFDLDSLDKLLDNAIGAGCTGIFACGSTGEPTNMSRAQYEEYVGLVQKRVNGRVPLCVGVIEPGTSRCIETIKRVQDMGVNFVSCTPNFYAKNEDQASIIRHYEQIAKETDVRMMIYNNLDTTGVNIIASTFMEISRIDNVVAYKDTRSDWENHMRILYFLRDKDISLVNGGEYLIGASFLMGSQANIAAASNLLPKLFVALYKASAIEKNIEKSLELGDKVAYLNEITRVGRSWLHGVKYAGQRLGLLKDIVAGPPTVLNDAEKHRVDEILDSLSAYH